MIDPYDFNGETQAKYRDALTSKVMEFVQMYASYLADEQGLHDHTLNAVSLGAESTFNVLAMSAREGGFLPEYFTFMVALSKYLDDNPSTTPTTYGDPDDS